MSEFLEPDLMPFRLARPGLSWRDDDWEEGGRWASRACLAPDVEIDMVPIPGGVRLALDHKGFCVARSSGSTLELAVARMGVRLGALGWGASGAPLVAPEKVPEVLACDVSPLLLEGWRLGDPNAMVVVTLALRFLVEVREQINKKSQEAQ